LELLAYVTYERSPHWDGERTAIKATFEKEIRGRLTLVDSEADRLVTDLWTLIHDGLLLTLNDLRRNTSFASTRFFDIKAVLPPKDPRTNGSLASCFEDRLGLSEDHSRVAAAKALVRDIAAEVNARYSIMFMPHASEDRKIPIEEIYVHRVLELQNVDLDVSVIRPEQPRALVPDYELADRRLVVVGNPGAGKSTFVKYLMHWLAGKDHEAAYAPVLVELKKHNRVEPNVVAVLEKNIGRLLQRTVRSQAIADALTLGYVAVVFDGL
jgi:hypothetical protein